VTGKKVRAVFMAAIMVVSMIAVGTGGIAAADAPSNEPVFEAVDTVDVYPAEEIETKEEVTYSPITADISTVQDSDVLTAAVESDDLNLWVFSEEEPVDLTENQIEVGDVGEKVDIFPAGEAGTYDVELELKDDGGDRGSASEELTISLGIQSAVDNADRDTVELAAGATFEEEDIRLATDNIELTSADADDPATIESADGDSDLLKIDNDGVTVSDIELELTESNQGAVDDSGGEELTLDGVDIVHIADERPPSLVNIAQPDFELTDSLVEGQVRLQGGADGAVIEHNTLDNLNNGGEGNEIRDNKFNLDTQNTGLTMSSGDDGGHTVTDNTFSGEQVGIALNSEHNVIDNNDFDAQDFEVTFGDDDFDAAGIIVFEDEANEIGSNTFSGEVGELALNDVSTELDQDAIVEANDFSPAAAVDDNTIEIVEEDFDVTNADEGVGYDDIESALDDAGDGDTIELDAGATFEEEELRLATDNIKLTSADADDPATIKSDDGDSDLLKIDNDGVTVSDVELELTESNQGAVDDSGGEELTLDGVDIVHIADERPTSLVNIAQPDFELTDSLVEGQVRLQGGADEAVIEGNTLDNLNNGGESNEIRNNEFSLDTQNTGLTMSSGDEGSHTVEDNTFTGEQVGIVLNSPDNEITGNDFDAQDTEVTLAGEEVDAAGIIVLNDDNTIESNSFAGDALETALIDKSEELNLDSFVDSNEFSPAAIVEENIIEIVEEESEIEVSTADELRAAAAGEEVNGETIAEDGTILITDDIDLDDSNVRVKVDGVTLTSDGDTREVFAESSSFPGSSDRGLIQVLADDVTVEGLDLFLDDEGEGAGIPVINIDGDEADSATGATVDTVHAERIATEDGNFAQVINVVGDATGATITESTLTGEGDGLNQGLTIQQVEDEDLEITDNEFSGEADIFLGLPDTAGTIEDNEFDASDSLDAVEAYVLDASEDLGGIQADQSVFEPDASVEEDFEITTGEVALGGDALVPDEPDGEPADPDVLIDHNPGAGTVSAIVGDPDDDVRAYADQLDIFVDTDDPVEFGGDAEKELRVVDPETDQAVTYTPTDDARTVPLDEMNRLGLQNQGDGEPAEEISAFPDAGSENIDATVEGDTGIYTDETFNEYVIELVDGDGDVLDSTDERLVGMGYEATFDQNGETATVTRDDTVDEDWTVTFRVTGDDEDIPLREQIIDEIELENVNGDDEFEVPIDELDADPGEYRWDLVVIDEDRADSDRDWIIRVPGNPDIDTGLTIPEPVTIENLEIAESGETVNDEVTVTADVEDAEAVELGVSADFTSFTTTAEATETETDEFEATIDASDVEPVGDGGFNAFVVASDETGVEVTDENEDQTVTFDTSTPDVSLSLVDLGSEEATVELEADEDIKITEATVEANGESISTDPEAGFNDERTVEFDGTPLPEEDETTFDVTIDVEDEAGNENTETADATISGFDVDDELEADVETSLDSDFVLNLDDEVAEGGDEGDLSASETDSNPTDDELAEALLGAQFVDISAVSIDEEEIDTDSNLEEATITVDLTEVGIDGVDDSELELAGVENGEFTTGADTIIEQEVDGDELVATVSGFSTYGVTAPDEDPEITETDVDPAEPDEDDDSVTTTFEYEANPNPEDSPIDTSETDVEIEIDDDQVDTDDDRVDVQITSDETTVTVDDLEANEEIEIDLTVVDDNGNEAEETERVTVDEVEADDDDDDTATGGSGGGGGGPAGEFESVGVGTLPDDVEVVNDAEGQMQERSSTTGEATVDFGSGITTPTVKELRSDNEDIRATVRVRDIDRVPGEIQSPPGEVATVTQIHVPRSVSEEPTTITFDLEQAEHSEIDLESAEMDDLTVWHHDAEADEWEPLPTEAAPTEENELLLETEATDFSYFAVTTADSVEEDEPEAEADDDAEAELDDDTEDSIPGFTLGAALVALLLVLAISTRRLSN